MKRIVPIVCLLFHSLSGMQLFYNCKLRYDAWHNPNAYARTVGGLRNQILATITVYLQHKNLYRLAQEFDAILSSVHTNVTFTLNHLFKDGDADYPLHQAITRNDIPLFNYLLNRSDIDVNRNNETKTRPLQRAILLQREQMILCLVGRPDAYIDTYGLRSSVVNRARFDALQVFHHYKNDGDLLRLKIDLERILLPLYEYTRTPFQTVFPARDSAHPLRSNRKPGR